MEEIESFEFYLGNFEYMLSQIAELQNLSIIRTTSYPHALARIEQFQHSYFESEIRKKFLTKIIDDINECELLLNDLNSNSTDHLSFLQSLKKDQIAKFPDIKLEDENLKLSADSKIIILEYLGVLKHLNDLGLNQKELAELLGYLLDRNRDNLKKSISGVGGKPKIRDQVKNQKSLNGVKLIARKLNYLPLIDKVLDDLKKID